MTTKEIKTRNRSIGKMLGFEIEQAYPPNEKLEQDGLLYKITKDFALSVNHTGSLYMSSLQFHINWNWIAEAVNYVSENIHIISENNKNGAHKLYEKLVSLGTINGIDAHFIYLSALADIFNTKNE